MQLGDLLRLSARLRVKYSAPPILYEASRALRVGREKSTPLFHNQQRLAPAKRLPGASQRRVMKKRKPSAEHGPPIASASFTSPSQHIHTAVDEFKRHTLSRFWQVRVPSLLPFSFRRAIRTDSPAAHSASSRTLPLFGGARSRHLRAHF